MRRAGALVVVVVVLAGCSGRGSSSPAPNTTAATTAAAQVAPGTAAAPPSTSVNPDVVPAVITPAYVDAVFKVLNHIYGDAVRAEVAQSGPPAVQRYLRLIYTGDQLAVELRIFESGMSSAVLGDLRPNPGDPIFRTTHIVATSEGCIYASVKVDPSPMLTRRFAPKNGYIVLLRSSYQLSPLNISNWQIAYEESSPPIGGSCR